MLVFTPKGFFSIVKDEHNPDRFNVSAQSRCHLNNLFPSANIQATQEKYCAWKVNVAKTDVYPVITAASKQINEIAER